MPAASALIIDLFAPRRRGAALGVFSLGATFGGGDALQLAMATVGVGAALAASMVIWPPVRDGLAALKAGEARP